MSIWAYIPGTAARQQRMFNLGLQKLSTKCDALVLMEWQDKTMTLHKADWNHEVSGWKLDNGKTVLPRGKGGDPKLWDGRIPIVQAHSEEYGVVSTEASLLAGAEETGHFKEVDATGEIVDADGTDGRQEAAADGGVEIVDHVPDYPVKGLSWDAVEYSLADAVEYDPNPVREEDARQAVEWASQAAKDQGEMLKHIAIGAAAVVAIMAFFLILVWLLGEVGNAEGGAVPLTAVQMFGGVF